jgi:hypothetical protein
MDQYELRFWRGWYHHMTLVILAHHFLVRLRQRLMGHATSTLVPLAPPPAGKRLREGGYDGPTVGDGR